MNNLDRLNFKIQHTFNLKLALDLGILPWLHVRHDLAVVVADVLKGAFADLEHALSLYVRAGLLVPGVSALRKSSVLSSEH